VDTPEFDPNDKESSPNARRGTVGGIAEGKTRGRSTVALAEKMLGDHADTAQERKKNRTSARYAGHVDGSPRGVKQWGWQAYYPGGAVQGKKRRMQR